MYHFIIFNDSSVFKRRASGAYRIATLLRQKNYNVKVIDYLINWNPDAVKDLLDSLVSEKTIAFGFSYTWMNTEYVKNIIGNLKTLYPNKKYFAGGQQPFQHEIGLDLMVTGYVEHALDDIINYLVDDIAPEKTTTSAVLNGILINADIDYPAPNINDLTVIYQDNDFINKDEVLTIELSRGCRFACKFCCYPFLGFKHSTFRDKNNVKAELLDNYNRFGITSYTIADDTLNDDDAKLEMLVEVVESLPFDVDFAAFIRIDLIATRPHQMELLKRARVWAHFYGIETFHPAAGKAIGKGMQASRIQDTLLKMRSYMLETLGLYRGTCGLIAGLPHEPVESWVETQQWMRENWLDQSWAWWPLDITNDKENTIIQSSIALNKEKYGYSEIADLKYKEDKINYLKTKKFLTHHQLDDRFFYWQNKHTDFFGAFEFVHNINATRQTANVSPNFYILSYKSLVKNNEELLKLPLEYEAAWQYKTQNIANYKNSTIEYAKRLTTASKML